MSATSIGRRYSAVYMDRSRINNDLHDAFPYEDNETPARRVPALANDAFANGSKRRHLGI